MKIKNNVKLKVTQCYENLYLPQPSNPTTQRLEMTVRNTAPKPTIAGDAVSIVSQAAIGMPSLHANKKN